SNEEKLTTVDEEIRVSDHALVSAVARALGLFVDLKSIPLLLAEIKEMDERVHDRLLAYIAAHHIYQRRSSQAHDHDSRSKLAAAGTVRDRRIIALRDAIASRPGLAGIAELQTRPGESTEPEFPRSPQTLAEVPTRASGESLIPESADADD